MVSTSPPPSAKSKSVLLVCDLGHLMSFAAANAFQHSANQRGLALKFFSTGITPFNEGRPPHRLATRAGYGKPNDCVLFVPLAEYDKYDAVVTFDHEQFDQLSRQLHRERKKVVRFSLAKSNAPRLPHLVNTPRLAYGEKTSQLFDKFRELYLDDPGTLDMISRCC